MFNSFYRNDLEVYVRTETFRRRYVRLSVTIPWRWRNSYFGISSSIDAQFSVSFLFVGVGSTNTKENTNT